MTMQPLTLVYSTSSAFLTMSVYHWAKSSSMEVMASTIFLLSAILYIRSFPDVIRRRLPFCPWQTD